MRRPRLSRSTILILVLVSGVVGGWAADRSRLAGRIRALEAGQKRVWDRFDLRHELRYTNYDTDTKPLVTALISQPEAFRSGLIAYLGLNRFRGEVNPNIQRTVFWHADVVDAQGNAYRCFLADHIGRWHGEADGAAYIVTDDSLNLLHWEGTAIDRKLLCSISCDDAHFPLTMKYVRETYPGFEQGCVNFEIKATANSIVLKRN